MTVKRPVAIEVGVHNGLPGFTQIFADGERQHCLFSREIAADLAWKLLSICESLNAASALPGDGTSVNDHCAVSLTPPPKEE